MGHTRSKLFSAPKTTMPM